MLQKVNFYLTLALLKDEDTGDYTAYYVQFPEAVAQGRTKNEAEKLLYELLPHLLENKKEEFLASHKKQMQKITFVDRLMVSE